MVFLETCVKHSLCSSNNIPPWVRYNIVLRQLHFILKCNPFAYAALFLKWYGISLELQALFLGYPLQNDGHNCLRRMHNSFISDKRKTSFRERAGLENTTNKEDWTFPVGILHASRKLSSILLEHGYDPKNVIVSDRISAICKQYSHPCRTLREYCVDALHCLT